jgi:hypothetical protein
MVLKLYSKISKDEEDLSLRRDVDAKYIWILGADVVSFLEMQL